MSKQLKKRDSHTPGFMVPNSFTPAYGRLWHFLMKIQKNKLLTASLNPNLDGKTEKVQVANVVLCDPFLNQ